MAENSEAPGKAQQVQDVPPVNNYDLRALVESEMAKADASDEETILQKENTVETEAKSQSGAGKSNEKSGGVTDEEVIDYHYGKLDDPGSDNPEIAEKFRNMNKQFTQKNQVLSEHERLLKKKEDELNERIQQADQMLQRLYQQQGFYASQFPRKQEDVSPDAIAKAMGLDDLAPEEAKKLAYHIHRLNQTHKAEIESVKGMISGLANETLQAKYDRIARSHGVEGDKRVEKLVYSLMSTFPDTSMEMAMRDVISGYGERKGASVKKDNENGDGGSGGDFGKLMKDNPGLIDYVLGVKRKEIEKSRERVPAIISNGDTGTPLAVGKKEEKEYFSNVNGSRESLFNEMNEILRENLEKDILSIK